MTPRRFADILGQHAALRQLNDAVVAGRLGHGLLFVGPMGVGKGTVARLLGRRLLCESPEGFEPCNRCNSCSSILADAHPDHHVVYRQLIRLEKSDSKARDLSVEVIRDFVITPAGRKSWGRRGKVFIIEEAHTMNTAAQNALLKTLEEPPTGTTLILLSEQPDRLLATIRSRTQRVSFGPIDPAVVVGQLVARGIDRGSAESAATLANGSLGQAVRFVEDGLVEAWPRLREALERGWGGLEPCWHLTDLLKTAAADYADRQLKRDKLASKDQATREGLELLLSLCAAHLSSMLRDASDDDQRHRLCGAIEAVDAATRNLSANVSKDLALFHFADAVDAAARGAGSARLEPG